ncbi:MAG TPA: serine/threonine-protein kinase [Candidatus Acidoferrum sp.]|nr:serine/threonine-protein kinase [Candidatus Acidoferrum sp.]
MATMVKAGRYEILGELGRGAMGVVYRAMDPVIGRTVAVKTIRLSEEGTGLTRPELLARFQTEARAAGLLTHPNIVVVYDAGEENGLYFITMELVEGKSLQALLDGGHAFPVPRVIRIMEQTCSALQFAHERNIVHRDVKPANLMLTADDTVKVTDFGTAKILQFGTVQQTAHVMGTPSYMSPEQVKGRPVDGRSDIFSIGVMLYEMLTGEKPFPGQSITTVIYKIVNEDPVPPRQINPSIHPGLNDIVLRALAKEPEVRYQSCRELLEDLRNYRALGGNERNPDATMISPRPGAMLPLNAEAGGLRGAHVEDAMTAATVRSLQNRAGGPAQTPAVRRTGPVRPIETPKKKNTLATVLAALFLVGVIIYGGNKLRPEFQAAHERNKLPEPNVAPEGTTPQPFVARDSTADTSGFTATVPGPTSIPVPAQSVLPAATSNPPGVEEPKPAAAKPAATPLKTTQPRVITIVPVHRPEDALNADALEYKGRIEEAIADRGLTGRVTIAGIGNTLTLRGKLRPAEHASLLRFMHDAPAAVHIVDDILYDDTPLPASGAGEPEGHPIPSKGLSAVHVLTDVIGAKATLFGPGGHSLADCQTPCSFNNLFPQRYSLQIQKDGYLQVQTAVALKAGESQDQKFHLEALVKGLLISSKPPGADIFINGAKQSGQTPTTLPLAPGRYDLVLRLPGYAPYVGEVQVKDNIQTTLDAELKERSQTHVAWAQVTTTPPGAEIIVDGVSTGQFSPSRAQIPAGTHVIALKLNGFQVVRRGIEVSEGSTVIVTENLTRK